MKKRLLNSFLWLLITVLAGWGLADWLDKAAMYLERRFNIISRAQKGTTDDSASE